MTDGASKVRATLSAGRDLIAKPWAVSYAQHLALDVADLRQLGVADPPARRLYSARRARRDRGRTAGESAASMHARRPRTHCAPREREQTRHIAAPARCARPRNRPGGALTTVPSVWDRSVLSPLAFEPRRAPARAHRQCARCACGTRDAPRHGMKTVLLIGFLALGPALADQLRMVPPAYADAMAPPVTSLGTTAASRSAIANATTPSGRTWLCGRGS